MVILPRRDVGSAARAAFPSLGEIPALSNDIQSSARLILCSCASQEEARRIAGKLIDERLAGCVSALPGMESTYRWQGAIERSTESLLLIKTDAAHLERAKELVLASHSYEVPEILVLEIAGGSTPYLAWLAEALK